MTDRFYSDESKNFDFIFKITYLYAYLFFQIYKNAKLQDFHIVGHSLGAHIAGYAGEKLISMNREAGKLGRITALDPAQPLFQNTPEFVRLDPGDADFVDVIHTDAKSILMGGLCNFDHLHILIVGSHLKLTFPKEISGA